MLFAQQLGEAVPTPVLPCWSKHQVCLAQQDSSVTFPNITQALAPWRTDSVVTQDET